MFVGHYGVGFAAKRIDHTIPAVGAARRRPPLDVLWAPCILLGIEKVRIVPGITATNPLDLYYMPYTHSLVLAATLAWSCGWARSRMQLIARPVRQQASVVVRTRRVLALVYWISWFIGPTTSPLYDNSAKVGLGLWNAPRARPLASRPPLLFGGFGPHLLPSPSDAFARSAGTIIFES